MGHGGFIYILIIVKFILSKFYHHLIQRTKPGLEEENSNAGTNGSIIHVLSALEYIFKIHSRKAKSFVGRDHVLALVH